MGEDTAHAFLMNGFTRQLKVSLVTPRRTPAVLDEPIVVTIHASIVSDRQDTVVNLDSTFTGKDTRLVELEL